MNVGSRSNARRSAIAAAMAALALAGTLGLAACTAPSGTEDENMDASTRTQSTSGDEAAANAYSKISVEEAQDMMDAGVTVVDVRTPQEYEERHIPGAVNIPVETIGAEKPAELADTDAELIVYCRTGVRSKQASDKLVELGYAHVNDMGGIVDWHGETVTGSEPGTR